MYTAMLLTRDDLRSQLPENIVIRALCYGSPPVFRWTDPDKRRVFREIIIIQNDKDGIISASSKSVIDLFNKTVAIDAADLKQDVMVKMLMEKVAKDAGEAGDDDDEVWTNEELQNTRADQDEDVKDKSTGSGGAWSWSEFKSNIAKSFDNYRNCSSIMSNKTKFIFQLLTKDEVVDN